MMYVFEYWKNGDCFTEDFEDFEKEKAVERCKDFYDRLSIFDKKHCSACFVIEGIGLDSDTDDPFDGNVVFDAVEYFNRPPVYTLFDVRDKSTMASYSLKPICEYFGTEYTEDMDFYDVEEIVKECDPDIYFRLIKWYPTDSEYEKYETEAQLQDRKRR